MRSAQTVRATFAFVSAALTGAVTTGVAHAQVARPTPIAPTPNTATTSDPTGWIVATALIFGLLVAIGVVVKLYDLRRKREAESVHLQAQISDALLRDPALFGLPVAANAHVPLWSGTPATIELTGDVPDPDLRAAVLRIAELEARRIRPDIVIADRMMLREAVRAA
jgi:hypothetical protein